MKKPVALSLATLSILGITLISCTPKNDGDGGRDVESLNKKINKQNERIIGVEDELHELRQLLDRNQREVAKLQISQESAQMSGSNPTSGSSTSGRSYPAPSPLSTSPLIPSSSASYPGTSQSAPSVSTNSTPALTPAPIAQPRPIVAPAPAPIVKKPTPTPATQPRKSSRYTVKRGDTLSSIAKKNGVTLSAIKRANPKLNPNRINVGAKITIPGTQGPSSSTPSYPKTQRTPSTYPRTSSQSTGLASNSSNTRIEKTTYRIRTGDTLSGIARKNGISLKTLQSYNAGVDSSKLSIGKRITIPVRKSNSTPQAQPQRSYASAPPAQTTQPARSYNVATRATQIQRTTAPVAQATPVDDHGPKKMIRIARETSLGKIAIDFGTSVHTLNSINSASLNSSTKITAGSLMYVPVR